jgi:hypothetical protein
MWQWTGSSWCTLRQLQMILYAGRLGVLTKQTCAGQVLLDLYRNLSQKYRTRFNYRDRNSDTSSWIRQCLKMRRWEWQSCGGHFVSGGRRSTILLWLLPPIFPDREHFIIVGKQRRESLASGFCVSKLEVNCVIWKDNFMAFRVVMLNFD